MATRTAPTARISFGKDAQKRAVQGILIKFIEEQCDNKYLNGAMLVLSKDEVNSFIDGCKANHDIWRLRRYVLIAFP